MVVLTVVSCCEPDCDGMPVAHGLCNRHYSRQYRQAVEQTPTIRRHRQAMRIVKQLPDEDDRWTLLAYVYQGNTRVEQALSHAA